MGHLQVAAPWCAAAYFRREDTVINDNGWLQTGDLAALEPGNRLRITDRLKDVIKSGGEWVSSIDLENAALGHPSVAQAAVIGIPHPRWQERPAIYVVKREGTALVADDLLNHLSTLVAKWWLPEEVIFVNDLPYNSTGKVRKEELRRWYREGINSG
jgi:fatty-acyl-CoA synthase